MRIEDISRVYVINLARREDRWTAVQDAWKAAGVELPLTRFVACDGNDFSPPKSWDVGRGAYGCYLSHLSILTEAVRTGVENFLIFEDDACFAENFGEKLGRVLKDLPADYDQLYLGWQALHADRVPPVRITDVLGRCGNCNGNHAYHCYLSIPQLVFQSAGKSDICGKQTQLNSWAYTGTYAREYPPLAEVRSFKAAFGRLGRRGYLGYEGRKADIKEDERTTILSAHAPSALAVAITEPVTVAGCMNSTGNAREPVRVHVDGVEIGTIQQPRDQTPKTELDPGDHWLEFLIDKDQNAFAHTYWIIEKRT